MIKIEDYIILALKERQQHLDLTASCIERGGNMKEGSSGECRGLLAHTLDTTIPFDLKIHCCHACHNKRCSNPLHLYWGTAKENSLDAKAHGKKSVWEFMVAKYGYEKAMEIRKSRYKLRG